MNCLKLLDLLRINNMKVLLIIFILTQGGERTVKIREFPDMVQCKIAQDKLRFQDQQTSDCIKRADDE